MKHLWKIVAVTAIIALIAVRWNQLHMASDRQVGMVAIIFDPTIDSPRVFDTYNAVLDEEGIPHRWVPYRDLILQNTQEQLAAWQVMIFPDSSLFSVPTQVASRATQFAQEGGRVMVVYDAGVKEDRGTYRRHGVFADLLGIDYEMYAKFGGQAYGTGSVQFASDRDAEFWQIPPGKLDEERYLSGYGYGKLTYPVAATQVLSGNPKVYASSAMGPVLSLRKVGNGDALWVGLPLSALKASGDDLPMRAVLRTFIGDVAAVPHLIPSPRGMGGLVIDWHIDSNTEFIGIPKMIEAGMLRKNLRYEFDVTAGPDCVNLGDGQGYDATGQGRSLLLKLMPYGVVGSHGGWAHDWFSEQLEAGKLSQSDTEKYVAMNNKALEKVTGKKIVSYAAPMGTHPQPWMTGLLEKMGIKAYYYTGDSGAPPTRSFYEGSMLSDTTWAFPIMPNRDAASFYEMIREAHMSDADILKWLDGTLEYVIRNKTIRLVYSHPRDLQYGNMTKVFGTWLDHVEKAEKEKKVDVEPMPYYADFLSRFIKTTMNFEQAKGKYVITLKNPQSLRDFCAAVPARFLPDKPVVPDGVEVRREGVYQLFTINSDVREIELSLEARDR